jgi:hypothetical protein
MVEMDSPNDECEHGPPIVFQEDQIRLHHEIEDRSETLNGNHSGCVIWKTSEEIMEKTIGASAAVKTTFLEFPFMQLACFYHSIFRYPIREITRHNNRR